jgi:hypothetical protein
MPDLNRRLFLGLAIPAPARKETVYHFATREWDVRMTVEFYDRYTSNGFWFDDRCFSAKGEENHNCLTRFSGSIAVVRYGIRPYAKIALRERVRTIDQDSRLNNRAPFERTLDLKGGVASDIQAFGYEGSPSTAAPHEPWCLLRQDLYFDGQSAPFLVVHWKHTLSAIRLVDVIPGEQTRVVAQ